MSFLFLVPALPEAERFPGRRQGKWLLHAMVDLSLNQDFHHMNQWSDAEVSQLIKAVIPPWRNLGRSFSTAWAVSLIKVTLLKGTPHNSLVAAGKAPISQALLCPPSSLQFLLNLVLYHHGHHVKWWPVWALTPLSGDSILNTNLVDGLSIWVSPGTGSARLS